MKRVFLILLMQCSLFAFGQEKENKLTVKEIIFNGSFDSKNKIVQTSKDEQTTRTLMKINTQKPEPMVKYIILENDSKGTAIASSYMLSKEEIKSDDDLFKFSINSYDVIYNDPSLSKANQDAGKDKTIKVGMKHNGEPIDLSTANLLPSCAEGEGFCIDWYWQTWVNGELVDETFLYTTCNCGGGGGSGNGNPPPSNSCTDLANEPLGEPTSQILSITYSQISPLSKIGSYVWKCHTAGTWWFNSFESSILTRENETSPWVFATLTHSSNSFMNGYIHTGLAASMTLRNSNSVFVTQTSWNMVLDYDTEVKCIDPAAPCNPNTGTYSATAIFSSIVDRKPIFNLPGYQTD